MLIHRDLGHYRQEAEGVVADGPFDLVPEVVAAFEPAGSKPYASLALAITVATLNNFTWNRLWTWSDRVKAEAQILHTDPSHPGAGQLGREFGKYAAASGFGSALQYGLTLLLSGSMDYRLANVIAIVIASVSNFLANDKWTFKRL